MEEILLWRSDLLTQFFMGFRVFGSETFYMLILPIGYWCWRVRLFSHLIQMLCWGTITNFLLKSIWQVPRPNVPHLVDVVGSYSFPSGDVQVATAILGVLAWNFKKLWLTITVVFLILGVGLSRVYFGVHYPIDVICGLGVGLLFVGAYAWIDTSSVELPATISVGGLVLLTIAESILLPAATKSLSLVATAVLLGFILGERLLEHQHGDQLAMGKNRSSIILTGVVGILGLFALRVALKSLGDALIGQSLLFSFTRYFITGMYVSFGSLYLFRLVLRSRFVKEMKTT